MRPFVVIAAFVALVDVVNVLSALHDAARRGESLGTWEPITWEATSGVAELVALPIIVAALRIAPPDRARWGRVLAVHGLASLAFSAAHVALMMTLRIAVYGALGFHYRVEAGAAPYEYRKDLLAYLVLAGVLHLFTRKRWSEPEPVVVQPPAPGPATFDIALGARTLRVRTDEILAVRSAGNYAEFLLDDGRRPLMRVALSELADRLEPHGIQRTHRSWLTNLKRARGLQPTGSGDHVVTLDGGVEVPLSRRFPAVLEVLRAITSAG